MKLCKDCKWCDYDGESSMGYSSYYDEDGKHHDHDPNIITTSYHCSNDHEWCETYRFSCWCGWRYP